MGGWVAGPFCGVWLRGPRPGLRTKRVPFCWEFCAQPCAEPSGRHMTTKRDFTLTLGFALQRASARMVRNADLRRRRNRASERYASGAKDHEDLGPDSSGSPDSD